MRCPDQQTLSAFVDGELETAQAAEVGRHVAQCPGCRQFVEEMQWLDHCGRAALGAIHVRETAAPNMVGSGPLWPGWVRPLPLAAAAAVVLALSISAWFASSRFSRHPAPSAPTQMAGVSATSPGTNGPSGESEDPAFEQWAAPYRERHVPLVSMEVAAGYDPAPIRPVLP